LQNLIAISQDEVLGQVLFQQRKAEGEHTSVQQQIEQWQQLLEKLR